MSDTAAVPELDPDDPRPVPYRRASEARISTAQSTAEAAEFFLKTPGGALLALAEEEKFLWDALDGSRSFRQIERGFRARFQLALRPAQFAGFLAELVEAGAVEIVAERERSPIDAAAVAPRRIVLDTEPSPESGETGGERGEAAMRAAGQRQGLRAGMKQLWSWPLGNPERLFDFLAAIFWPIRFGFWLLIPAVLVAFMISVKHSNDYWADWNSVILDIPLWPCLWLAEHVTTWTARTVEGMVIHGFGGRVKHCDMKFFLGIFIRINLDETSTRSMTRRQKLWIAASPLLSRLAFYAISMQVWVFYRPTHPLVADVAMFMAFMGLITFCTASCPLIPLYGYKFLATLLDQENLYARAFRFLVLRIRGRQAPGRMTLAERWGLVLMSVGTAVFTTLYIGHILYSANAYFVTNFGGFGSIFGVAILAGCALYFIALWRFSGKLRAMQQADRAARRRPPGPVEA
jgi:hypothetical protein